MFPSGELREYPEPGVNPHSGTWRDPHKFRRGMHSMTGGIIITAVIAALAWMVWRCCDREQAFKVIEEGHQDEVAGTGFRPGRPPSDRED